MDIQFKNNKYKLIFKVIAWALCIAGLGAAALGAAGLWQNGWTEGSYTQSSQYKNAMQDSLNKVYRAFYTDERFLSDEISARISDIEAEREDRINSLTADSGLADAAALDAINKLYDDKIEQERNQIENNYAQMRAENMVELENRADILYVVEADGKVVHTNMQQDDPAAFIQTLPSFTRQVFNSYGTEGLSPSAPAATNLPRASLAEPEIVTVLAAMPNNVFEQNRNAYNEAAAQNIVYIWLLAGGLAAYAAGFAWLLFAAGKTPEGGDINIGASDAIPLDAGFVLMLAVLAASVYALVNLDRGFSMPALSFAVVAYIVSFTSLGTVAWNMWFISLAKRIRRKEAGRHTVFWMLLGSLGRLYRQSGIRAKAVWLMAGYILAGVVCTWIFAVGRMDYLPAATALGAVLLVLYIALSMRWLLKKGVAISRIMQGLKAIQSGELDHTIPPEGGRELEEIADGINHIADGFQSAVSKEVKAERLKTELITNISHDLKTPLTSIIAYIDLLKKEELGENAGKYADVLDLKAKRLQVLTEDLFEAAKAASGDITVNMSKIELVQFMQQVLGEMSDKIEKSGLVFIKDIPDDKMYVLADGRLLWRVMGNVLDNVLKYALSGSRVYIDVKKTFKTVSVTVKNISSEPLNIPKEELMERFRRGDASRHTEGSGLGLSIAKDLMGIMGCGFEIEIDGDLFKVVMKLNEA